MISGSELLIDHDQKTNPIPLQFSPHHSHHTHSATRLLTGVKVKVNGKVRPNTGHVVSVDIYCFFSLDARWQCVFNDTNLHFTTGKETRYQLYRRLGWPQGRRGRVWKISPPPSNRYPDRPDRSLVANTD
jgi:hypothetical protein